MDDEKQGDVVVPFGLAAVDAYFNNWVVRPLYWIAQGTVFWALFVLVHDWLRSLVLIHVMFGNGTRISHRTHHQNHGHVENDESWPPVTR